MLEAACGQHGFDAVIFTNGCDLSDDVHVLGGANLVGACFRYEQSGRAAADKYE